MTPQKIAELRKHAEDWSLSSGHIRGMLDEALDEIERLQELIARYEAMPDTVPNLARCGATYMNHSCSRLIRHSNAFHIDDRGVQWQDSFDGATPHQPERADPERTILNQSCGHPDCASLIDRLVAGRHEALEDAASWKDTAERVGKNLTARVEQLTKERDDYRRNFGWQEHDGLKRWEDLVKERDYERARANEFLTQLHDAKRERDNAQEGVTQLWQQWNFTQDIAGAALRQVESLRAALREVCEAHERRADLLEMNDAHRCGVPCPSKCDEWAAERSRLGRRISHLMEVHAAAKPVKP